LKLFQEIFKSAGVLQNAAAHPQPGTGGCHFRSGPGWHGAWSTIGRRL